MLINGIIRAIQAGNFNDRINVILGLRYEEKKREDFDDRLIKKFIIIL